MAPRSDNNLIIRQADPGLLLVFLDYSRPALTIVELFALFEAMKTNGKRKSQLGGAALRK
jgi:hypothetical protein